MNSSAEGVVRDAAALLIVFDTELFELALVFIALFAFEPIRFVFVVVLVFVAVSQAVKPPITKVANKLK
jgi:hypothetical protein